MRQVSAVPQRVAPVTNPSLEAAIASARTMEPVVETREGSFVNENGEPSQYNNIHLKNRFGKVRWLPESFLLDILEVSEDLKAAFAQKLAYRQTRSKEALKARAIAAGFKVSE